MPGPFGGGGRVRGLGRQDRHDGSVECAAVIIKPESAGAHHELEREKKGMMPYHSKSVCAYLERYMSTYRT